MGECCKERDSQAESFQGHGSLVGKCRLPKWQIAAFEGGSVAAWYAMPDLISSRPLRVLLKLGLLGGCFSVMMKHCELTPGDLVNGRATRLAKESLSSEDGDVDCCGSPKQPAPDREPVGVTPDGRPLLDKLTDQDAPGKKPGEPCGCGCAGKERPKRQVEESCLCSAEAEAGEEQCPVVDLHQRVKALFAGDLRRGWPVLAAGLLGGAAMVSSEKAIYALAQARARRGARLPHLTNGVALGSIVAGLTLAQEAWAGHE